jgi:hypothetical protein
LVTIFLPAFSHLAYVFLGCLMICHPFLFSFLRDAKVRDLVISTKNKLFLKSISFSGRSKIPDIFSVQINDICHSFRQLTL